MTPTNEDLLALAERADSWNRCWPGNLNLEKLVADLSAALRAIVAERQKPQAVKIKPLVWVETFEDRGDGTSEHNGGYEADSIIGFYEIGMGFGSDAYYWSVCDPNYNEIGSFEDPSYAKAAAQADYEARILATLDVSGPPAHDHQRDLVTADERQAIRDKAMAVNAAMCAEDRAKQFNESVDLTLFRQAIRAEALEDAAQCCEAEADKCDDAVKWGGGPKYIANCKAAAYAMRDRAYAIRVMKGTKA